MRHVSAEPPAFFRRGPTPLTRLSILSEKLGWSGGIWDVIDDLDFGLIGVGIILIFLVSWIGSTLIYRWKGYDNLAVTSPMQGASPEAS